MHYLYVLVDPRRPNWVRYVGITNNINNRYCSHISILSAKNRKTNWIKNLQKAGIEPIMNVIGAYDTREEVIAAEIKYIKLMKDIGFDNLTNGTNGGEGRWLVSFVTRKKMSESKSNASELTKQLREEYSPFISLLLARQKDGCVEADNAIVWLNSFFKILQWGSFDSKLNASQVTKRAMWNDRNRARRDIFTDADIIYIGENDENF